MRRHQWLACALGTLMLGLGMSGRAVAREQQAGPRRGVVVEHNRFDDHDREVARNWYTAHANHLPPGLRERDRLSPDLEVKLEEGFVLDRAWRARIQVVPVDLIRLLPVPPRGTRYVFIGGHLVLIDARSYRVLDVIHLGHVR